MADLQKLVARLAALPGTGTARDYRDLLGPTVHALLREAGDRAEELVERQLATSTYRPTPAELRVTWATMVSEAGQERDARIAKASSRCRYCWGVGQVRAFVHSRRKGTERVRAYSVTCGCPRGQQLNGAQLHYGRRMSRGELEATATAQAAQTEWHDGVLAFFVDDNTTQERPEWCRWFPALHPPETSGNLGRRK
jgi:hypothetical protein